MVGWDCCKQTDNYTDNYTDKCTDKCTDKELIMRPIQMCKTTINNLFTIKVKKT